MKNTLYRLFEHDYLSKNEAQDILTRMSKGEYNESQIAAFITVFLMRSITIEELMGFRNALMDLRIPVDLSGYNAIDIVGTGGDNKNTFNISTAACFVVAGAGYQVIKHGNYGSTSISGSSNVIEAHGVKFTADVDILKRSIDRCNIAFLHAPLFNSALKIVAPVRKALGVRTFFNMLGPLANPSKPKKQLLGVYNLKLGRLYSYLYQQENVDYTIVNSLDGFDEISLTSEFKVYNNAGEDVISPEDIGFKRTEEVDLFGGDTIKEAAIIFNNVLSNSSTLAQQNVVLANAAYAIKTMDNKISIQDCIEVARESIISGKALQTFKEFISINS
jgi:anthranilate phosphoribosyltransferase